MATTTSSATTCYRHPDRETGVRCSSCGRPICPDCMTATPVGMRCPECSKQTTQVRDLARTTAGSMQVTRALIAVNVVVFLAQLASGGSIRGGGGEVYVYGATFGPLIAEGEVWRIATGGFLHGGIFHLGLNMVALWFLGQWLESDVGSRRFGLIYGVSLLGGALGVMLLDPLAATAGASGAIYGLFGALMAGMRSRGMDALRSPLGFILGINLLITFTIPNISIGGHLGGLAMGFVVGLVLLELPGRVRSKVAPAAVVVTLGVLAAVGAYLLAANAVS
ncbi:MAG: rhomboid family intramembrane serine protease [Actinomycetota bacterium]|nr:rhomboid family intramembrane serine protease [Actinomycetota bacterium]